MVSFRGFPTNFPSGTLQNLSTQTIFLSPRDSAFFLPRLRSKGRSSFLGLVILAVLRYSHPCPKGGNGSGFPFPHFKKPVILIDIEFLGFLGLQDKLLDLSSGDGMATIEFEQG